MSTSKNWNNTNFNLPDNREPRGTWGAAASAFLKALADNALSKFGGSFPLTGADVNFGNSFGLIAKYLKSVSTNIAQSGFLRLANTDKVAFRNAANDADLELTLAADRLTFAGTTLAQTKADVGLGNVDNTSDATKNAAAAVLTNKDFDGGTASNTSRITVPQNTYANLLALTRKEGTLLYANDLDTFFADDGTNLTPVGSGSGSGSGELNAIANPSAATDTTGWTGVTRVTSGSPLAPTVPTAISIANTAAAESSTSGGYYPIASLAPGLRNRKLKVEFWFTTPATDTYRVSVYNGVTRIPLDTDSAGATTLPANSTGKFSASFDTTSAASYTLSVTRTSGSAGACLITNVIIGPGVADRGYPAGPITHTPVAVGFTLSANNLKWRREGEFLKVSGRFDVSSPTGVKASLSLPAGCTPSNAALICVGKWIRNNGTVNIFKQGVALMGAGATVITFGIDDAQTSLYPYTEQNANTVFQSTDAISIAGELAIPILEWAGSGTVNIGAGANLEYAFNTSTSTSTDTTSFGYGPQGALIQNFAPSGTTGVSKRVRFTSPIQDDDVIALEINDGQGFVPFVQRLPGFSSNDAGSTWYGIIVQKVNSTDVDLTFYSQAWAGVAWGSFNTYRWRLRKAKAAAPVGFGMASATESGLVAPRKGQTTLTVTNTTGLTGWSTTRAVGIYYQDQDGNHRLKFNLRGSITGTSSAIAGTLNIAGVTVKSTTNFFQAFSVSTTGSVTGAVTQSVTDPSNPSTAHLVIGVAAGTTVTGVSVSGDIELDSKPSWA